MESLKTFEEFISELKKSEDDPCWDGYVQLGMKDKDGRQVPNCVPKDEVDESVNESFHSPDGTPIGVDSRHRPIKTNEEYSDEVTLNITISNIDKSTAEDFLKMFAFMEWSGNVGASREFNAYFDGDGHFRPKIKVEGYNLKDIDFDKERASDGDGISLGFGA